jgi:hypothetical protein
MSSPFAKVLLGVGIVATLGACASLQDQHVAKADRLARIHQGLTQDEVRAVAGAPQYVGKNKRTNETLWSYEYTDEWGYRSEFGVDFDNATGLVSETSSERTNDD